MYECTHLHHHVALHTQLEVGAQEAGIHCHLGQHRGAGRHRGGARGGQAGGYLMHMGGGWAVAVAAPCDGSDHMQHASSATRGAARCQSDGSV